MAVGSEPFLHLSRPLAPATFSYQSSIAPLHVNIQHQTILAILNHANRRDLPASPSSSSRVIGAIVGSRSEDGSDVSVSDAFAIPHTENEDQVEVDVEYQKNMLSLHLKANPRETLLGWYTTSLELNSFSALIQNFFASPETGTFPHPAIHLTVSTEPGTAVEMKAYISTPVAVNAERAQESCLFIQVPHSIAHNDAEQSALALISSAKDNESRSAPVATDIESLTRSLESTTDLLDRVSDFVSAIMDEEREPNNALGQYLMGELSLAPKVDPSSVESDFNNHIQDVLMVSYLTNSVRTQIDLSHRLATAALADAFGEQKDGEKGGERGERGQRGGKRGGRGGGRGGGGGNREPREPREPRENGE